MVVMASNSPPSEPAREQLTAVGRTRELAQSAHVAAELGDFEGVLYLARQLTLVAEAVVAQRRTDQADE
jgi:hypothetical protein